MSETILDVVKRAITNYELHLIKPRHQRLAYLLMHMENMSIHPDDYLTDSCQEGWSAVLSYSVLSSTRNMPDGFKYPVDFLTWEDTLTSIVALHPEDDVLLLMNDIEMFLQMMKPSELDGVIDSAQKLYLLLADDDEDSDIACKVRGIADVLNWVQQADGLGTGCDVCGLPQSDSWQATKTGWKHDNC